MMKAPVFFPYAGINEDRGYELKPQEFSRELEAGRFFNKLLQADWKAGKIGITLNDNDEVILGAKAKDVAKGVKAPEAPKDISASVEEIPLDVKSDKIPKLPANLPTNLDKLPPVSEEKAPTKVADTTVKVIEPVKPPRINVQKEIKSSTLADLNKPKPNAAAVLAAASKAVTDTPGYSKESAEPAGPGVPTMDRPKSSMDDIKTHMGGLV